MGVESWLGPCNRLHIVVSRPVWKLPVIVTSQNWRQDLWILEIINYRSVFQGFSKGGVVDL